MSFLLMARFSSQTIINYQYLGRQNSQQTDILLIFRVKSGRYAGQESLTGDQYQKTRLARLFDFRAENATLGRASIIF